MSPLAASALWTWVVYRQQATEVTIGMIDFAVNRVFLIPPPEGALAQRETPGVYEPECDPSADAPAGGYLLL